jgi:phage shock protein PspC (stress-responsive transcriptional regulator)
MTAVEFLRNSWRSGVVTGGVAAYLGMRVEPFRSHFLLAALAAIGIGVLAGIIEVGARKTAQRSR